MLQSLKDYVGAVDNDRYRLAGSTYHTLLRSPVVYSEESGGIKSSEPLAGMLHSEDGTNDAGGLPWSNRACPSCLTTLPCQKSPPERPSFREQRGPTLPAAGPPLVQGARCRTTGSGPTRLAQAALRGCSGAAATRALLTPAP
jgi:hypothetical protein